MNMNKQLRNDDNHCKLYYYNIYTLAIGTLGFPVVITDVAQEAIYYFYLRYRSIKTLCIQLHGQMVNASYDALLGLIHQKLSNMCSIII